MSYKIKEEGTNLKEHLGPHKLMQSPPAESVKASQIGETHLPPVGLPGPLKVMKKGQPPQRHYLPPIRKDKPPRFTAGMP